MGQRMAMSGAATPPMTAAMALGTPVPRPTPTAAPNATDAGRPQAGRSNAGGTRRSAARGAVLTARGAVLTAALALGCEATDDTRAHAALAPASPLAAEVTGSLTVPLVTTDTALYRLRRAVFGVERAGALVLALDSEASLGADALTAELDPGQYQLRLRDGWALEQLDAEGAATVVRGALTSPNPTSFEVRDGRVTTVAFIFTTSSGAVTFGEGAVSVHLGVADPASLASCDVANQTGCDEGQHCLIGNADGKAFCATPGELPLGAPCSAEQCVLGAQCLSLDRAAPQAAACTALCNLQSPPFGCDCRGLGTGDDIGVCGPPPPGTCDLLDLASCPAGQACQFPGGSFGVCGSPGAVTEGSACFGEECAAGLDCFGDDPDLGISGTCFRFCDVLAPSCEFCFAVDTGDVGRCFL